ncbi:thiol-disulfide oxidoreductase DCC family protein [Oceanisphaera sp. W20_SRM_FM3]|uniref:thiol-disulfide oxidoreductase DCC family protein n=1 Tax=Oceanisphaera sp. W20_SRM_FM3 TaxID=3240267 RepID=UPI003F94696D
MLTVFYDGRCGLCDREIAFYRRHADADSVLWLDIWLHEPLLLAAGLTQAQCLQKLHLLDEHNQLHTGVDAFLLLWQTVPKLRGLAWLARFAPFRGLLAFGYRLFLVWYKRQPHVQACLLADKKE